MKANNIHWVIRSPLYLYKKKHLCPECGQTLHVVKRSEIMSYEKAEAKGIHLNHLSSGKTKVVWRELECPDCGRSFTVEEMKRIEDIPK